MSVFKDSAVVLKVQKIQEKNILYQVFSRDFGKISVTKKYSNKEKNIDLGNEINFEIITKESVTIHTVRNIKILSAFNTATANFSTMNGYMEVLQKVNREFQAGIQNREIFDLLVILNKKESLREIDILLAKLKIDCIEGVLKLSHHNPHIQKILSFIDREHFSRSIKLKGFTQEIIKELEKIENN